MSRRNDHPMTVNEIVASLAHSSRPCLIVEGSDDMQVFRLLCKRIGIDLQPCGGRKALLEVYRQRDRFTKARCAFFADRDTWLFSGVPSEYRGIIFTHGYSIENDIIAESEIFSFYGDDLLCQYNELKHELSKWWGMQLLLYFKWPAETNFSSKIGEILDGFFDSGSCLKVKDSIMCNCPTFPLFDDVVKDIEENFDLYFRGHQLHELHKLLFGKSKELKTLSNSGNLLIIFSTTGISKYFLDDKSRIESALSE